MDVVVHEAMGPDLEVRLLGAELKEGEVGFAVGVGEEDVLAVGDVVGGVGGDDAGEAEETLLMDDGKRQE
jgi:hypothetical protein